jgi:4-hydroxybenzoate polyprenyltransferase and related prenyltransferases
MQVMSILQLVRPINLLLIALTQIFVKFALFSPLRAETTLSNFGFILLVVATLCIAAGGNIINDIYDVEIDRINKPNKVLVGKKVREKVANRWYIVLTVLGVGIGFYLSNAIGRPGFAALFILISALLYLYASYLKGMLVVGNLLISVLVAVSLIIVGLFDLLPAITIENQASQLSVFKIVLAYALFAFLLNFIREIVKDIQDINGDKNGGVNTLPIAIGRKRTTTVVFILGVVTICCVVYYMYLHLYHSQTMVLYFLGLIVGPLLFFVTKAWNASNPTDFALLSKLLKMIMFLGICSLWLYPLIYTEY